jgi:hypothetical protein
VAAALLGASLAGSPAEGAHVYVKVAPPAPRVEVRVVAPSAGHVWIGGYHRWNGTAYVWFPGRYELPPRHGQVWVPGHWANNKHGHYWVEGHWK